MTSRAAVYLPDSTSRSAAATQVAGRAMLVRTPLTAERASVSRIGVPACLRHAAVEARIAASPRLSAAVVWFDRLDGEVARLTFQESAFGEWLDFTTDTLIHAALVLGMGVTASRVGGSVMVLAGAGAAFGVILSALFAQSLSEGAAGEERLATVLKGLGTRDLFYMVLVAFLLGLWFAPRVLPVLVALLAVGSQGYWLTCLGRRLVSRP